MESQLPEEFEMKSPEKQNSCQEKSNEKDFLFISRSHSKLLDEEDLQSEMKEEKRKYKQKESHKKTLKKKEKDVKYKEQETKNCEEKTSQKEETIQFFEKPVESEIEEKSSYESRKDEISHYERIYEFHEATERKEPELALCGETPKKNIKESLIEKKLPPSSIIDPEKLTVLPEILEKNHESEVSNRPIRAASSATSNDENEPESLLRKLRKIDVIEVGKKTWNFLNHNITMGFLGGWIASCVAYGSSAFGTCFRKAYFCSTLSVLDFLFFYFVFLLVFQITSRLWETERK